VAIVRSWLQRLVAPADVSALTPVKGGYEAATVASNWCQGYVFVWRYSSATQIWRQIAKVPVDIQRDPAVSYTNGCIGPTVPYLLTGNPEPIYLVWGSLSGDGSTNAAVIADGKRGWGVVAVHGRSLASLGAIHEFTGTNREWGFRWVSVSHGQLVTRTTNWAFGDADADTFGFIRVWRWVGRSFVLVRDNLFYSHRVAAPDLTDAPLLANGACPTAGTYRASFAFDPITNATNSAWGARRIHVFPVSKDYPRRPGCNPQTTGLESVLVEADHEVTTKSGRTKSSNTKWITAPLWVALNLSTGYGLAPEFLDGSSATGDGNTDSTLMPWIVSPGLGINSIVSDVGYINDPNWKADLGFRPYPGTGTVTFSGGRLVSLAVGP
jgi:hypothetical protein